MKIKYLSSLSVAALLGMAVSASASLVSVTGDGAIIPTPAAIGEDTPTNTVIEAFEEAAGFVLGSSLAVDGGSIGAGRVVNSHMVFLNSDGRTRINATAAFTFGEAILGVISDTDGTNIFASDFLGGGVDYSDTSGYGNNRGLEGNDSYSFAGSVLDINMIVTEPGDWVRVVTAAQVPVPAGMLLLPTGLFALGAMRRKKRKAA